MEKEIIGIVGAGAMGSGIARVAATAGHRVILVDVDSVALEKAKSNLDNSLKKLIEKGKLSEQDSKSIFEKIQFAGSINHLKDCDLVIEAIIENLGIKQKTFSEIEKIISGNCILASNTSSLSITSLASACNLPSRFFGIHFFNPVPLMPLVEIIPGITSDTALLPQLKSLAESWNKTPVVAKDTPGFIVNRIARPFYGEAIRIFEEGFADFSTIDWAVKEFGGFKMGPFELMDMIGNDINFTVTETVWTQMFYDPRYKPSLIQKRLFEAKRFGKKSGIGYYDYAHQKPEPLKDKQLGENICWRIVVMLINEAADALYYGIATREDIDLAMTKGVNYPKGLLRWADEKGLDFCLDTMERLYAEYRDDRYRPSVQFRKMKREGRLKFYE